MNYELITYLSYTLVVLGLGRWCFDIMSGIVQRMSVSVEDNGSDRGFIAMISLVAILFVSALVVVILLRSPSFNYAVFITLVLNKIFSFLDGKRVKS